MMGSEVGMALRVGMVSIVLSVVGLSQGHGASTPGTGGFRPLTHEEAARILPFARTVRMKRLGLAFAEAADAARKVHSLRRELQGDAWHETVTAREAVEEIEASRRVSEDEDQSSLLQASENLRVRGIESLLRRAGVDGSLASGGSEAAYPGKLAAMKARAAEVAAWRARVYGKDLPIAREAVAWVGLCGELASPHGVELFDRPLHPRAVGIAGLATDLRRYAEYLVLSMDGGLEDLDVARSLTDTAFDQASSEVGRFGARAWLAMRRAEWGRAAAAMEDLGRALERLREVVGRRTVEEVAAAEIARVEAMGFGAAAAYKGANPGLGGWCAGLLADDRRIYGERHPATASSHRLLGLSLLQFGQYSEAARNFAAALRCRRAISTDADPEIAIDVVGLAIAMSVGSPSESRDLLGVARGLFERLDRGDGALTLAAAALARGEISIDDYPRTPFSPFSDPLLYRVLGGVAPAATLPSRTIEIPDVTPRADTDGRGAEALARRFLGDRFRPQFDLADLTALDERFPGIGQDAMNGRLRPRATYRPERGAVLSDEEWELAKRVEGRMQESVAAAAARDRALEQNRGAIEAITSKIDDGLDAWARGEVAKAETLLLDAHRAVLGLPVEVTGAHVVAALAARSACEVAGVLIARGRYAEAKPYAQDALAHARTVGGVDVIARAGLRVALLRGATIRRRTGDVAAAASMEAEAVALTFRDRRRPLSLDERLKDIYGEAVARRLEGVRGRDRFAGGAFLRSAREEHDRGNFLGALARLDEARRAGEAPALVALERGGIHEALGQLSIAEGEYRIALAEPFRPGDPLELAYQAAAAALCRVLVHRGRGEEAAQFSASAMKPVSATDQGRAGYLGIDLAEQQHTARLAIAGWELGRGDFRAALSRLRAVVSDAERGYSSNPFRKAYEEMRNVGAGSDSPFRALEPNPFVDPAALKDALERQMLAMEQLGNPGGPDSVAGDRRRLAAARAALADAVLRDPENTGDAEALGLLVSAVRDQRDLADAGAFRSCARIADVLMRREGRHEDAAALYREAIDALEHERAHFPGDPSDRARTLAALVRDADPYAGFLRAALAGGRRTEAVSLAFAEAERGRGRALLDLLQGSARGDARQRASARVLASADSALRDRFDAIVARERGARARVQEVETKLRALVKKGGVDPADLAVMTAALEVAQASERAAHSEYRLLADGGAGVLANEPLDAPKVAAALREGEMLLFYEIGDRDAVVIALEAAGVIGCYPLTWRDGGSVARDELAAVIQQGGYRGAQVIPRDAPDPGRGLSELAGALVPTALRQRVEASTRLFIVPDDALHALPFEALLLPPAGADDRTRRLWLDHWPPVVYGASATTMVSRRREATATRPVGSSLVALGDPELADAAAAARRGGDPQTAQLEEQVARLKRLPGSAAEAQAIAAIARRAIKSDDGVIVLLREQASAARLFEAAASPRHLHIGAHGVAVSGSLVYESALLLTPSGDGESGSRLRLADLVHRWPGRLDGTRIVTLSACQTATGRLEPREGVVALVWGFLAAGAESVVATRWSIDDHATALFMERLYQNLFGDFDQPRLVRGRAFAPGAAMPRLEALHEAQIWLRTLAADAASAHFERLFEGKARLPSPDARPFASPEFWAAFELVGLPD